MPKDKETKEEREKRLKAVRKKLSKRSRERYYTVRQMDKLQASDRGLGSENFKLSKEVISENVNNFKAKYKDENSDFQKRIYYLQNTLSKEEYEASPEHKMNQMIDALIQNGIEEYSQYASVNDLFRLNRNNVKRFDAAGRRKEETEHLKKARKSFSEFEEQVNALLDSNSPDYEMFQNFYSDIKDLKDETERIVSGGLIVPEEGSPNTIHIKLDEEPELIKEEDKGKVQAKQEHIEYRSFEDEPLFSHDPCPEDVQQGRIGDCYFIATMSAIAETNPDFIRNCMKDNGDGTVTVRLYDDSFNEVYTTVKKTVPMRQNDDGSWTPLYARGALWAAMLEKAYVQSGIAFNLSEAFAEGMTRGVDQKTGAVLERNNFEEIVGGRTEIATETILGFAMKENSRQETAVKIPKIDHPHRDYDPAEIEFFNKIKDAYAAGKVITAGIARQSSENEDNLYQKYRGLPPGHAYSIIGTHKDETTGKLYIKVRNPHMLGARTYDVNGKAKYDPNPEIPGESTVELKDFAATFRDCFAATFTSSYFEEREQKLVQDNRAMYGDAVEQACKDILGTDHAFVWTNSKSFKDLKKAAIALRAEFRKGNADPNRMEQKLKTFFKAANTYREDRDTRNQSLSKDSRDRSVQRYLHVEAIRHFEEIYRSNSVKGAELQYVDFSECKEHALDMVDQKEGIKEVADQEIKGFDKVSQAKAAAVKGTVRESANVSTVEDAEQLIKTVETSGLDKIEKGLKNYNTNDLLDGLCEVIASRSAKAHQKEVRPQDIERSLSPECISRVRNHFGKKLETALKGIDKKEFMEIMSSGNIGEKMAAAVTDNLNNNEKQAAKEKLAEKAKDPAVLGGKSPF